MLNFICCYDSNGLVLVSVSDILFIQEVLPDPDIENDSDLTCITMRGDIDVYVKDSVSAIYGKIRELISKA